MQHKGIVVNGYGGLNNIMQIHYNMMFDYKQKLWT